MATTKSSGDDGGRGAHNVHLVHSNSPRPISSLGSVSCAWELWALSVPVPTAESEVWQPRWWWGGTGVCEWVSGGLPLVVGKTSSVR